MQPVLHEEQGSLQEYFYFPFSTVIFLVKFRAKKILEQLSVFILNLYRKDYLFPLLKLNWASVWLHFHTSFLGA